LRVLVTGASGVLGKAVVRELLARGHRVSTLQRGPAAAELAALPSVRADVASPAARRAAAGVEAVLHLAGRGDVEESWRAPLEYLQVLVGGTLNVLEGARTVGARVIVPSTQRVYRPARRPISETAAVRPGDPYAVAKLAAETFCRLYAERYGLATRAVRLFSVYAPGQRGQGTSGVVAIFVRRARASQDLVVQAGPRRDLTYVDDAARGLCLALEQARPGFRVYNIATGRGMALEALARTIVRSVGSRSRIVAPTETWQGGDLVADLRRARRELGYEPEIGPEEGLRRVLTPESRVLSAEC
jgi:nucleoside-diphosphate-sugar epimerase